MEQTTALEVMSGMNRDQIDLVKNTVAKGASDNELKLFLTTAKRTGLDPFARQIFFVKRGDTGTIQTGIDGLRVIAERTGRLAGISDPEYTDQANGKYPEKATVVVKKIVAGHIVDFPATARWTEYSQSYNGKLSAMWEKMPYLMLGKCAEALALRKAFPANLSGLTAQELEEGSIVHHRPEIAKAEASIKTLTPAHYKSRILHNITRLGFTDGAKNRDTAREIVFALTGIDPSVCDVGKLPECLVSMEAYKDTESASAVYEMAKQAGIVLVDLNEEKPQAEAPTAPEVVFPEVVGSEEILPEEEEEEPVDPNPEEEVLEPAEIVF